MSRRLLVVDDQPHFTNLVEMVFGADFEVLKAADGDEGMAAAAQHQPGIILLDIMMPRISGLEMLRRLQKDPRTSGIPVIIVTASQLPAAQEPLKKEPNVRAVLSKMAGVEALRAEVARAMP